MIQLQPHEYAKVSELFAELTAHHLFATAVLHHHLPGRIYVDDVNVPKTGFMSSNELQFLAGDPDNEAFNTALKQLLQQTIFMGDAPGARLMTANLSKQRIFL
jgi:hypothetical protein